MGGKSLPLIDIGVSGEERSSTDADESFSLWGDEGVANVGATVPPHVGEDARPFARKIAKYGENLIFAVHKKYPSRTEDFIVHSLQVVKVGRI